jgi:hypothetical protein
MFFLFFLKTGIIMFFFTALMVGNLSPWFELWFQDWFGYAEVVDLLFLSTRVLFLTRKPPRNDLSSLPELGIDIYVAGFDLTPVLFFLFEGVRLNGAAVRDSENL